MSLATPDFFSRPSEQSRVKSRIVAKYFKAWARVITSPGGGNADRIGYMDLFSGRGEYDDGTASTPLLVLRTAIDNPDIGSRLEAFFNDSNAEYVSALEQRITGLAGVNVLRSRPKVANVVVDESIAETVETIRLIPTLLFIDPWGYKGLSIRLVDAVLKDWACECILFFNYNRVNAALSNDCLTATVDSLFGRRRAERIRARLESADTRDREEVIESELAGGLTEQWGRYVLQFKFKGSSGKRTRHQLVFVSKHQKGYDIMKDIMARESTACPQGIPTYEHNPAHQSCQPLFPLGPGMADLEVALPAQFAGQRLKMRDIYWRHNVGLPYVAANYKRALVNLEEQGKIATMPPAKKRPRRNGVVTFGDSVVVTFPPQ